LKFFHTFSLGAEENEMVVWGTSHHGLVLDLMSMSADVVFVAPAAVDVDVFFFVLFLFFFVFVGNDVDFLTLHCRLRRSIKNM